MGLLDNFEQKLDRMVNGAFAKAFKSEVQPVEIAANLQREIDRRAAIVTRSRTVVPNAFRVELSTNDHQRLSVFGHVVREELETLVRDYAQEQRYTFVGPVEVTLAADPGLTQGAIRIRSEVRQGADQPLPSRVLAPGQPHVEVHGIRYPLHAVTRLGRSKDAEIRVDDPGVSRLHAEITLGSEVTIRDLNSTNGTIVDGRMVSSQILRDGARIQLGTTTLTYRAR